MGTITLQLTQKGMDVTGSVRLSQTTISDVPGTLKGTLATASLPTTMQVTVTYSFGPFQCQGMFGGTFDVTSREIDGSYTGQNCVHTFGGSLRATKSE